MQPNTSIPINHATVGITTIGVGLSVSLLFIFFSLIAYGSGNLNSAVMYAITIAIGNAIALGGAFIIIRGLMKLTDPEQNELTASTGA